MDEHLECIIYDMFHLPHPYLGLGPDCWSAFLGVAYKCEEMGRSVGDVTGCAPNTDKEVHSVNSVYHWSVNKPMQDSATLRQQLR